MSKSSILKSIKPNCHFTIHNIPFGVFSLPSTPESQRPCSAIGDWVIDLSVLEQRGIFNEDRSVDYSEIFSNSTVLNPFMSKGKKCWSFVRKAIINWVSNYDGTDLSLEKALIPKKNVKMHLPIHIPSYTDFYASREHATNVGTMFRGKENALNPNWLHLPVGYHGHSPSVIISGTDVVRPKGQVKPPDSPNPVFSQCRKLDYELEMAWILGTPNPSEAVPIDVNKARDHIFGMAILNDWSARDIQAWEYVPLGPFLGKNFATSLSPWIVTLEALEPFLVYGPSQNDPAPLSYLEETHKSAYDIDLEVKIITKSGNEGTCCKANMKYLYWSIFQQLAHHTINGCPLKVGSIGGTGTISGSSPESLGSLLEASWNGSKKLQIGSEERTFLEDYDTVVMTATCKNPETGEVILGFGDVSGKILPCHL